MLRKLRIISHWFKTEPGWVLVLIALMFSVAGTVVGVFIAGTYGAILSAIGGLCAGYLTNATLTMVDKFEEINNTDFKKGDSPHTS